LYPFDWISITFNDKHMGNYWPVHRRSLATLALHMV
jgi:hypothetical protein